MGRHSTIQKNRVFVECTDEHKRVKAWVINKDEKTIKVELPTGFVMTLEKKYSSSTYKIQVGTLEFISDGKPVV